MNERKCATCQASLQGMHPNRKYCSDKCSPHKYQSVKVFECVICGKPVVKIGSGRPPKYCEPGGRCSSRGYYLDHREDILSKQAADYAIAHPKDHKRCVTCGADITHLRVHAKHCGESCKREYRKEARAAEYKAWAEAHPGRRKASNIAWRLANADHVKEYTRNYSMAHADARKAYEQRRLAENPDFRRAISRRSYRKHRRKRVAASVAYHKANPALKRQSMHKRRMLMLNNPGYTPFSQAEWEKLVHRFNRRCAYCGRIPRTMTMDHVVPLARRGRHAIANILPACQSCNSSKGDLYLWEWRLRSRRGVLLTMSAELHERLIGGVASLVA
jgi:hypothetical protein